jgi:hypothetical protein
VNASADKTGPQSINDRLRIKRAETVKTFLIDALGVKSNINIVTDQAAFSKMNLVDRRAIISVTVK